MLRATAITSEPGPTPFDIVVLTHDERHLRRKLLTLQHGEQLLVDLPEPVMLGHGDRLVLEDGRHAEVIAAEEPLLEIRAGDTEALMTLAWHFGNRHLPAHIERERILLERDLVIMELLAGRGATWRVVSDPFQPARGAYHAHGTGHAHGHGAHHHHHD
jgi:urease accessory protein